MQEDHGVRASLVHIVGPNLEKLRKNVLSYLYVVLASVCPSVKWATVVSTWGYFFLSELCILAGMAYGEGSKAFAVPLHFREVLGL